MRFGTWILLALNNSTTVGGVKYEIKQLNNFEVYSIDANFRILFDRHDDNRKRDFINIPCSIMEVHKKKYLS